MARRKHLIVALAQGSLGETLFGIRIARALWARGEDAVFLADASSAGLMRTSGFQHRCIPGHEPAMEHLDELCEAHLPATIVLADGLTTHHALEHRGESLELLADFDEPVFTVDTWNTAESGLRMDAIPDQDVRVPAQLRDLPRRLVPVPFVRPDTPGGCNVLPIDDPIPAAVVAEQRAGLGLTGADRAVLLCTSAWQQRFHDNGSVDRATRTVPELVGTYLRRLGSAVHLFHVGPAPLPMAPVLGARYHHRTSLGERWLRVLVAAADLVLSLDPSAATNTTALLAGVPVLALTNSWGGWRAQEALDGLGYPPSQALEAWLRASVPLHRSARWPMSYHRVLTTLLDDNPYQGSAIEVVELLDERLVHRAATRLLFDGDHLEHLRIRRRAYLDQVRSLPRPVDRILAACG